MFSKICSNRDPVSDLVEFLRLSAFLCKKGGGEIDAFSILMGVNGIASYTIIMKKKKLDIFSFEAGAASSLFGGIYIVFLLGRLWGGQV